MSLNDYHFIDRWRVRATLDEVWAILSDGAEFPRWWPGVYLEATEIEHGTDEGLGRTFRVLTQGGRFPWTLLWTARTVKMNRPHGFSIDTTGDFVATGEWTFVQDGEWVDVTYEWNTAPQKPVLKYGAVVFKPIFAANHRFAMRVGEASLKLELERRRARTAAERALVPPPPGLPFTATRPFKLGLVAVGLLLVVYAIARNAD